MKKGGAGCARAALLSLATRLVYFDINSHTLFKERRRTTGRHTRSGKSRGSNLLMSLSSAGTTGSLGGTSNLSWASSRLLRST